MSAQGTTSGGTRAVGRRAVREIMRTDVVTVAPDRTVADLVDLLEREGITGVPVVDADGTVVGVVSVTDVARAALREASGEAEEGGEARAGEDGPGGYFRFPDGLAAEGLGSWLPAGLPRTRLGARAVREIMTPATFSVRPEATVRELARFLSRGGIHRALVFEGSRLAGVVTATDVLRALAGSTDG